MMPEMMPVFVRAQYKGFTSILIKINLLRPVPLYSLHPTSREREKGQDGCTSSQYQTN